MDLNLEIGLDASLLSKKLDKEAYNELKTSLLTESKYTCSCCEWQPKEYETWKDDSNYLNRMMNYFMLHIEGDDESKVETDNAIAVCRSCFCIKHIDQAVSLGYVKFVNSRFDQKKLIKISWSDFSKGRITDTNRERAEDNREIISLKKDPKHYLDRIRNDIQSEMIKVVFTDKFFDYNIKYENSN